MRIGQPVDAEGRPVRQQDRVPRHGERASAPAPARRSRCCRRRTPPATGSRSCSACRCASRSTRRSSPSIRCGSACRCRSTSTRTSATASACRSTTQHGDRVQTDVFDSVDARRSAAHRVDHRRATASSTRNRRDGDGELARAEAGGGRCRCADAARRDRLRSRRRARRHRMSEASARCRVRRTGSHRHRRRARQPQPAPLTGATLALGTVALSLATFMNVLDTSIANVSMPAIAGDLGVSPDQGTWVITSFGGRQRDLAAADRLAHAALRPGAPVRRVGAAVRASRRACARWRRHSALLIAFRVLQGAVAGPDDPAVAVAAAVELSEGQGRQRARDVGDHHAGRAGDGPAARRLDHRQHLVAVDLLHQHSGRARRRRRHVDDLPRRAKRRRASCRSTASASACSCCGSARCRSCSTRARTSTGSARRRSSLLAVVAVVGFALFLIWELTEEHPVVDLRLFARRNFWTSTLAMSLAYGLFFGNVVLLPLWLQQYMGYTATQAGHGAGAGGRARDPAHAVRRQERAPGRPAASSRPSRSSCFALVLCMRSHFNTSGGLLDAAGPDVIQGAAMAFFFIPLVTLSLSGLTPDRIPAASGPVQLRAHHRGLVRHVDLHDAVGPPRDAAPRAARRAHQRRRPRNGAGACARCRPAGSRPTRATRRSTAWSTSRRSCCRPTTCSTCRRSFSCC